MMQMPKILTSQEGGVVGPEVGPDPVGPLVGLWAGEDGGCDAGCDGLCVGAGVDARGDAAETVAVSEGEFPMRGAAAVELVDAAGVVSVAAVVDVVAEFVPAAGVCCAELAALCAAEVVKVGAVAPGA